MNHQEITLRETSSGKSVSAELISGVPRDISDLWASSWEPVFKETIGRLKKEGVPASEWPHDARWRWAEKLTFPENCLAYQSYAIVADGSLEGLMLLNSTKFARLSGQQGEGLVYIELLATAPWNRIAYKNPRKFSGVGAILCEVAVQLSFDYEFKGRIGLHSLPESEDFYRNTLKMTELGIDNAPGHRGLTYFEMTPDQATLFLGT